MKPELDGQLSLPRNLQWKLAPPPGTKFRVLAGPRTLPCNHGNVRVKITTPGIYTRRCEVCKLTHHYILERVLRTPDGVKLRWVGAEEAADARREELRDCAPGVD